MAVRQVTGFWRDVPPTRPARRPWLDSGQVAGRSEAALLAHAVASLLEAVAAKDPYTRGHSRRVARYARTVAEGLGLGSRDRAEVALAAELHDVGKIGVPDELLQKAGPLSPEERCRILDHAAIGERILAPLLGGRPAVLAAVRWHHERMDGSGYPDGLTGRAIPLIPRILAVADAFDAMTSERPYRPPLPRNMVLEELQRGVGTQFDPDCVWAFLDQRWAGPMGRCVSC
jgi:HD-GYP domain-containing protein (c-di-GMP phosphodiesterase class II)